MWLEHGPCAPLIPVIAAVTLVAGGTRAEPVFGGAERPARLPAQDTEDHRARAAILRHLLAVGEARGYQPATAHALALYAMNCGAWLEPVERSVAQARDARDALVRHADPAIACFTYLTTGSGLLHSAPTLDEVATDVEAGLAFMVRVGQSTTVDTALAYRQLLRALRGQTTTPGGFSDGSFDADAFLDPGRRTNVFATTCLLVHRALVAALRGDLAGLARDIDAATPSMSVLQGSLLAQARLLRSLALAHRVREAGPAHATRALAELDGLRAWHARRAAEVPANYAHLRHLVDAERAWATGDPDAALRAFDAALRAVREHCRPWHAALIAARAGQYHLENGLEHTGRYLLGQARAGYAAWGATVAVRELDARFPDLAGQAGPAREPTGAADTVDVPAVLRAAQILTGETDPDRLYAAVVTQLGALTGADAVALALLDPESGEWSLPAGPPGAADLPLTVLRHVERTRETLLVRDATRDDRFARDPYLAGLEQCSLLVVPLLDQGTLRGMLVLADRRAAGAFTAARRDAATLVAGPLAVSLDNALRYRSLERLVADRTRELAVAHRQLEIVSSTDGLTKLANRRRFAEILDREWARATRNRQPVSIILIDIDDFKRYNDHYGHLAGDECLRRVAAALRDGAMRATDLVCRYGGEEFAIVLPETQGEGAATVAGRVREAVRALAQPHAATGAGVVTVSVGYATAVPAPDALPETLIDAAEDALSLAKSAGRDGSPPVI
jgi:diguanylate cyclase (GGDEF)-like protein